MMPVEKNGVGAEPTGGAQGHCRVNPEFTSLIAGGRDDPALVRPAADDHRFAAQIRAGKQFHGNEKGIHIHVQDGGALRKITLVCGIVLGAESSQVRHGIRLRLRREAYNRSAESTRGMPLRSLVTRISSHRGVSSSGSTAGRLSWPSSTTSRPPGFRKLCAWETSEP